MAITPAQQAILDRDTNVSYQKTPSLFDKILNSGQQLVQSGQQLIQGGAQWVSGAAKDIGSGIYNVVTAPIETGQALLRGAAEKYLYPRETESQLNAYLKQNPEAQGVLAEQDILPKGYVNPNLNNQGTTDGQQLQYSNIPRPANSSKSYTPVISIPTVSAAQQFAGGGATNAGGVPFSSFGGTQFGAGGIPLVTDRFSQLGNLTNLQNVSGQQITPLTPEQQAEEERRKAQERLDVNRITTPTIPSEIDFGGVQDTVNKMRELMSSNEALATDDWQNVNNSIEQVINSMVPEIKSQARPEPPLTEEQARTEPTIREQILKFKEANGYGEIQKQKLDLMAQLNSTNAAFQAIVDDINNNPNLPKGLAQRRIEVLQGQQKTRINQLMGQLEIANENLSMIDKAVSEQFQLLSAERSDEERRIDNARQNLNILISSGAIAQLTDADLTRWSNQTGFSTSELSSIKNIAIKEGNDAAAKAASDLAAKQAKPAEQEAKLVNDFRSDLANNSILKGGATREQFIRQLQAKYPEIDPNSISEYVYGTYPDGYDANW